MPRRLKKAFGIGHGHFPREHQPPAERPDRPGKFRKMLDLPALAVPDDKLKVLAGGMLDPKGAQGPGSADNELIPAGFTYFGQFVDHDISLDTTSVSERLIDPGSVRNFRTPVLELDSVYGAGPRVERYLYDPNDPAKLILGATRTGGGDPTIPAGRPNDLPRVFRTWRAGEVAQPVVGDGVALIGDPRNDENLIVSQLHVAFLKFHNRVVDTLPAATPPEARFATARRKAVWHYQKIVLTDFVRRLVEPAVLDDVLANGRKFFLFDKRPFMPVEFSVAAYRLGHSMVREVYDYNRVFNSTNPPPGIPGAPAVPATLDLLFQFTELSGDERQPMPVPSDWIIDWSRFFNMTGAKPLPAAVNRSRAIDPLVTEQLHHLPGDAGSLPFLNLRRGVKMGLPSGQAVAARMRLPPLAPADLERGPDGDALKAAGLTGKTPLWYYVLKEAQVHHRGRRLGPVGSRIVAEVFVGLLQGHPESFLAREPGWRPDLPRASTEGPEHGYTMVDLLAFVGDVNPLG